MKSAIKADITPLNVLEQVFLYATLDCEIKREDGSFQIDSHLLTFFSKLEHIAQQELIAECFHCHCCKALLLSYELSKTNSFVRELPRNPLLAKSLPIFTR